MKPKPTIPPTYLATHARLLLKAAKYLAKWRTPNARGNHDEVHFRSLLAVQSTIDKAQDKLLDQLCGKPAASAAGRARGRGKNV